MELLRILKIVEKTILINVLLFFIAIGSSAATPKYYGKHVVLVVDQVSKGLNKGGCLEMAGKDISSFLKGEVVPVFNQDEAFSFDPEKDCLEVFMGGMTGFVGNNPNWCGDALNLRYSVIRGIENDSLFSLTIDYLLHPEYKKIYSSISDFNRWIEEDCDSIFSLNTPVARTRKENSGYGLSYYMLDAVVPLIDRTIPAQEYYIMCVSTFELADTGQGNAACQEVLNQIYAGRTNLVNEFSSWLKSHRKLEWITGVRWGGEVAAYGYQPLPGSSVNSSPDISTSISLEQDKYLGDDFTLKNGVSLTFQDAEDLNIKDVYLTITNDKGDVLYDEKQNARWDELKKTFIIDEKVLKLENLDKEDDLNFKFSLFPQVDGSSKVLPYVFVTDVNIPANTIIYAQASTYNYLVFGLIALLIIIGIVLYYYKRGKDATCEIDMKIKPISPYRFMDVTDNKVVSADAWYFRNGSESEINVKGVVKPVYPSFSKKYALKAEFEIQDSDGNDYFTFRPSGFDPNGAPRSCNITYPLEITSDGEFHIEVISFMREDMNEEIFANLDRCKLQLKVVVRAYFEDKSGNCISKEVEEKEESYTYIVRPDIADKELWVAFDPGTTGSCVAYGYGGTPANCDNIKLVSSQSSTVDGGTKLSPIFYSKLQILDQASIFNGAAAADMQLFDSGTGEGDYRFGNEAHIFWGSNSFQSIKKLLGYDNELTVRNRSGVERSISGHDLAHLLVKGLVHEFERFIRTSPIVNDRDRNRLIRDDQFSLSRAMVAVPNNYTVNKVQAMVDTIKRTNRFKEVHYLYEAEGVMMYYLNRNWSKIVSLKDKKFVVFDMGGATINATAFDIDVETVVHQDVINIKHVKVNTISRVGYTVGGDNIDYALIKIILQIPSLKKALDNVGLNRESFEKRNKKRLIKFAQAMKFDYIQKTLGSDLEGNMANSEEAFWIAFYNLAKDCGLEVGDEMSELDKRYLNSRIPKKIMNDLVKSCVKDAVDELISDGIDGELVLIPSGRSTLYPGIQDIVLSTLNKGDDIVWDYEVGAGSKEEIVKTAVARGACWYGMFSRYVELCHDKVTSTFGYIDLVTGSESYIPVINKNTKFNEIFENVEAEVSPLCPTLTNVKFIQMLGSNHSEIYAQKIYHKMAELNEIECGGDVEKIKIKVDSVGNFDYEIKVQGNPDVLTGKCKITDADISTANSEAYVFAALPSEEDTDDSPEPTTTQNQEETTQTYPLPPVLREKKTKRY